VAPTALSFCSGEQAFLFRRDNPSLIFHQFEQTIDSNGVESRNTLRKFHTFVGHHPNKRERNKLSQKNNFLQPLIRLFPKLAPLGDQRKQNI